MGLWPVSADTQAAHESLLCWSADGSIALPLCLAASLWHLTAAVKLVRSTGMLRCGLLLRLHAHLKLMLVMLVLMLLLLSGCSVRARLSDWLLYTDTCAGQQAARTSCHSTHSARRCQHQHKLCYQVWQMRLWR